eukprot:CAMPEP_0194757854 /NCGR_PEP_ID=MMETSP0323_2-20130528/11263_1 /TAXON_ID=2866 ORGANISM="Crypthecodinium cohnii, Strain Seligo" /NCGR_SAMPLE_ID=MMETSP0323_2 /ASSEMBLY_ACC=CAM_ASM_000346 /LENGTH=94 /DNA_ID=CAMNT_0039677963 /DNA_START=564 /DNA_END=848 /DNA_ORIENTATION=-
MKQQEAQKAQYNARRESMRKLIGSASNHNIEEEEEEENDSSTASYKSASAAQGVGASAPCERLVPTLLAPAGSCCSKKRELAWKRKKEKKKGNT